MYSAMPGAEPIEVEVRVAGDERVERPEHRLDADGAHELALVILQSLAEMIAARVLADREHVGPVDQTPVAYAGEPEHEAEHSAGRVERGGGHAADFLARRAGSMPARGRVNPAPQISSWSATASSYSAMRREWAEDDAVVPDACW